MNRTKRVLSLALAIGMTLSLLIIPANAASFTDTTGHWAEKMIEQAVAHGYVPAGGAFQPNKAITRNEFARMVNGAFGLTQTANISFTDVAASDPYYKDVQKAVSAGYIAGYEDNTFRGTNLITRQEAAVIIARLVAFPNEALKTINLKDASSIAAWAQPAAKVVYNKGYMVGDNLNKFNPLGNLTRAETVKILETILGKEKIISGTVTINAKNDTIIGNVYTGNLIISDSIGRSSVQLTNCKVLGTLLVNGGGESGVRLSNTGVANMTVDSQYNEPGVAAAGDSTVYNTYLKTSAQLAEASLSGMGAGFKNVTIGGTSTKVSLTGTTFDNVSVNAPATLTLTSGKITNLNVAAAAIGTSVKLESGTNVVNAALNGAAVITGKGTVTNSTTGTGTGTGASTGTTAGALGYTTTPASGTTKVSNGSNIQITFEDVIAPTNGQILTTSWVRSNVVLRENTSTGTTVDYSASISQSGKILTIDPTSNLKTGTDYLLTVNPNAFKGTTNGKVNAAIAVAFSTDGKSSSSSSSGSTSIITDDMEPEFYPGDETDNIPVNADLTLTFDEKIYNDEGKTLTSTYLKDVIELRKGSESGSTVKFSATINSAKKVITIDPTSNLSKNTTYYLIVAEGALTNSDDDSNDELVYSFKTANFTGYVPLATPASGSTIETDIDFVFYFEDGVYDDEIDSLTSSYLENYVFEIREGSKNGTKVDFEAEIDDDDTITLITEELLDDDETYYIIMDGGELTDLEGDTLPDLTFVYYTSDDIVNKNDNTTATGDLVPTETSPEHKDTGVKASDNIKMLFSEDLYNANGKKITADDLEDAIEIRRTSQSGTKIKFDASYDTTYGLNVVELDPKSNLSVGSKYYVIVKEGELFDENDAANDEFVFYFTVGTSGTSELEVEVEADDDSAKLYIDYDYSEFDATKAYMTVYYRVEGGTWKTSTCKDALLSTNMYGTKTVTLSNLDEEEVYEFEVEVELYDGSTLVETDSYEDSFETDDYYYDDEDIAISTITVSGATGSSDYIYYDEFEYDDGVFYGELWDAIEPSSSLSYDYGRLKVKVNADDSDATVYIESDGDYTYGDDNETLYIEISEDEYDEDCVVLYITVEDSDGYETEYELTVWLEY